MDKVEVEGPGRVPSPSKTPMHEEIAGTTKLAKDPEALARSYGRTGIAGLLGSAFVVRCAVFAAMGGFLFGMQSRRESVVGAGSDVSRLRPGGGLSHVGHGSL